MVPRFGRQGSVRLGEGACLDTGPTDPRLSWERMRSAWLKLRRNRYFIGPYSDTPDITVIGPPPYFVLSEGCPPDELGRTIRMALDASVHEIVSGDSAVRLAEDRTLDLARLAGVKGRRTFERGARVVDFDCVGVDEILITPSSESVDTGSRCPRRSGVASSARQTPSWGTPQCALLHGQRPSAAGDSGGHCGALAQPNDPPEGSGQLRRRRARTFSPFSSCSPVGTKPICL